MKFALVLSVFAVASAIICINAAPALDAIDQIKNIGNALEKQLKGISQEYLLKAQESDKSQAALSALLKEYKQELDAAYEKAIVNKDALQKQADAEDSGPQMEVFFLIIETIAEFEYDRTVNAFKKISS